MQANSYQASLSLSDTSVSTDDEDDEDYCDGYGEYVYDVADKLRVVNAQLYADFTPVESERPRRVQFRDDPVEKIVCFSPIPDDDYYPNDDHLLGAHQDGESDNQGSSHREDFAAASDFVTTTSDISDGAALGYGILSAIGDSVRNSRDKTLQGCSHEGHEQHSSDNCTVDYLAKNAGSSDLSNGKYLRGNEQGCSSDSTGSDCDSVEEEITDHDQMSIHHTGGSCSVLEKDEAEISTSHDALSSAESDTSLKESPQHKCQIQPSVTRPMIRLVSSADSAVHSKPLTKSKQLRPKTCTRMRPMDNVQSCKVINLPKYSGNKRSVYGLPNEMKEVLQRKKMEERTLIKQREMQLEKEQEERRREAQQAFQAWLARKKCQRRKATGEPEKPQHTKHEVEQNVTRGDSQSAFQKWLERKRIQKQQEEMTRKLKELELESATTKPTREDAEKAYMSWLKKKEQEERQKKSGQSLQPALQRYTGLSPRSLHALELYLQSEEYVRYPEIIL